MINRLWLEREPGFTELLRQSARLFRHGLRHPLGLLLGSCLLTALLAGSVVLAKRDYAPRLVLRVVEAARDPGSMPEMKRKLAAYVQDGVFTSEPLLEIIRRYNLYPKMAARDPHGAVAEFRSDIQVDVYQNYFVEIRNQGGRPRSARVALSYRSGDRATALAVTRELGALIIARETAARRELADRAAAAAERAQDSLQRALAQRVHAIAVKQAELGADADPDPRLQVELVSLLGSLPALERQLDAAGRRAAVLDLGARFEQRGIGLYFEVADEAGIPVSDRRVQARLLGAVAAFLLGLPLLVMAVGAFNTERVRA